MSEFSILYRSLHCGNNCQKELGILEESPLSIVGYASLY